MPHLRFELRHPYEASELERIALLATVLPVWKYQEFHAITRDASDDVPQPALFFPGSSKSGQNSLRISQEFHNPWWMDSWQEPVFESVLPLARPVPPAYFMEDFDEFGWFTPSQWSLLAPLFPSQPLRNVRGCPPTSAHAVLSALLWKSAHHASWDELGGIFPPARTCRRYHKSWLLVGRLRTVYQYLIHDLLTRGRLHPLDLVQEGYYRITPDYRIFAIPGKCPDTWQTRTVLLLLQETYAVIRRFRREQQDFFFPNRTLQAVLIDHYVRLRCRMPARVHAYH
jgi:transposase